MPYIMSDFRQYYHLDYKDTSITEFVSLIIGLLDNNPQSSLSRRMYCRISTSEKTLRFITGDYSDDSSEWQARLGFDSKYWQFIRKSFNTEPSEKEKQTMQTLEALFEGVWDE